MASVIQAPIKAPPVDYSDDWQKQENDYIERVRAALKNATHGTLVGKTVRWQRADGYAVYMVATEHPLRLVHLDLGDGYQVEASLIRGLTLTDVGLMVQQDELWERMTHGPNEAFYTKERVGQLVHYSNGFGQFVRCEVVEAAEHDNTTSRDRSTIGGVALRPIALVGNWREYDLPRRQANGEVRYGYNAEQVIEGKLMQPHASNIYEYEGFSDRAKIDPRTLEPIDLTPPGMSPDDERRAALVRELDKIRSLVELADVTNEGDLFASLSAISEVAKSATHG